MDRETTTGTIRDFEVPYGYYVKFSDQKNPSLRAPKDNYRGEEAFLYVDVYQSLDRDKNQLSIEHVIKVGQFSIPIFKNPSMPLNDFLREIRLGIEKVIDPSKR